MLPPSAGGNPRACHAQLTRAGPVKVCVGMMARAPAPFFLLLPNSICCHRASAAGRAHAPSVNTDNKRAASTAALLPAPAPAPAERGAARARGRARLDGERARVGRPQVLRQVDAQRAQRGQLAERRGRHQRHARRARRDRPRPPVRTRNPASVTR